MDDRVRFRPEPSGDVRPPAAGEVHVWHVDLDAAGESPRPGDLLSQDEFERGYRLHFARDVRRFMLTRGALRRRLGSYLDCPPQDIQFAYGAHGKPALASPASSALRFNVSHSGGRALLAFTTSSEIGIDLERLTPVPDALDLSSRFFALAEQIALEAVDPDQRDRAFLRGWTCKEAFVKATGEGLGYPLDGFAVSLTPEAPARLLSLEGADPRGWSLLDFAPEEGFLAAVAVQHPAALVTVFGAPRGASQLESSTVDQTLPAGEARA
jgi:4'-phosphopantetheinyl transferase